MRYLASTILLYIAPLATALAAPLRQSPGSELRIQNNAAAACTFYPDPRDTDLAHGRVTGGTPGLSVVLSSIYAAPPFTTGGLALASFVQQTHDKLREQYASHNIFITRLRADNVGFSWFVADAYHQQAKVQWTGRPAGHYEIVVFRARGTLIVEGAGGAENVLFSGWFDKAGKEIYFHAPP